MNIKKSFKHTLLAITLAGTSIVHAKKEQVDFNQVGKEMSKMLMNRHYEKLPFDENLSERIFKLYIKSLDRGKVYFTQNDIDRLHANYGKIIHKALLQRNSIEIAQACHDLYVKRVKSRIGFAKQYLQQTNFTFDSDRVLHVNRKKLPWPKDEAAARDLWKRLVEEAVLSETLRHENIAKLAKEQGKENPLKDDKPIKEIIRLRYERMLKSVVDEDSEDVANYLLSAVAKSYDPHTDYFSAREYDRFKASMDNSFVGIGAMLQAIDDGSTKITGIVVGGPAAKGGELMLNDKIIGVDHLNDGHMTDIMFMKINKVVDLIRGPKGSSVKLKIITKTGESKTIIIKRGKIETADEFAKGQIIESKNPDGTIRRLGIITLPSFYVNFQTGENRCSNDVRRILNRMKAEKIDGLILDLRGNGGGSLEEVRVMTGLFTGSGPVVQEKDSQGRISLQTAYRDPIYKGPMICLIDQASASASEILAGALQDYNRALIVGSASTFGKGTVQQAMDIARMLPFNAKGRDRAGFLKPTIRKFYRVAGSSTQNKGVESDIVLPNILDALEIGERYLDYALPHDEIRTAPGYKPLNRKSLFIDNLKAHSQQRINQSIDFKYLKDDIARTKQRIKKNTISLNKAKRLAELEEADKRTKLRNKERIKRFKQIQERDKKKFTFKRVNREDAYRKELKVIDPSEKDETYMKLAKDKTQDLDTTPEWPSQLDPVKREGMEILNDLINLSKKNQRAHANR